MRISIFLYLFKDHNRVQKSAKYKCFFSTNRKIFIKNFSETACENGCKKIEGLNLLKNYYIF